MTLHIVDVSKYQVERSNPLNLALAKAAGMGAVNIALDRGRDTDVLPGWARDVAEIARGLELEISTYRWLDGRMGGVDSARRAYTRMREVGGGSTDGMVHAFDAENNPLQATERIIRDYALEMTQLLGRPVVTYTGDHWWTAPGRGWNVTDIAPYLWAAPNAGYQPAYPGDQARHWLAGYGGWADLAIMQYSVKALPGTGDCSLSAVRDPAVWAVLTGKEGSGTMTYADPALVHARTYLIGRGVPAASVGIVGDRSHRSTGGYHVGNDVLAMIGKLHTDYSKRQTEKDRPGSNAAMALDIGGLSGRQLADLTAWLIAQCRAGTADTRNIREVIGRRSAAGGVILYDALGIRDEDDGSADHAGHTHISYYRDSEGEDKTSVFRRYFEGEPAKPPATPAAERSNQEEDSMLITFIYASANGKTRWGLGVVSGGDEFWYETDDQAVANSYGVTARVTATQVSAAKFDEERVKFVGQPA